MFFPSSLALALLPLVAQLPTTPADTLRTVAERSEYKATARHADVASLCQALARTSPNAHYTELGKSAEGRPLPLLILADPPVRSPEDAAKSGKLVVLVIGNIHGGEVCGKEALPMLAREILRVPHHPILSNLIVAMAPIFNADGNERVSKKNRPHQNGPEDGVGERANARGLDLNRDFIKLEAPETRALVRFFNAWNPHLFIDTHTTNGSRHRYTITYEGPRNLAGDRGLIEFAHTRFLPAIDAAFEKASGLKAYYYGSFDADHTHWNSFPPEGRFGTNYFGLRNRIGVLSEAYAYAPFKVRVLATLDFVREALKVASSHRDEIVKALDDAERKTTQAGETHRNDDRVVLRSEPEGMNAAEPILGYVETVKDGKRVRTDEPKDYPAAVMNESTAVESVARPFAYLIPPDQSRAVETLQRHGAAVLELREDLDLDVEAYRVDEIGRPAATGWDRQDVQELRVSPRSETRRIPAGTRVVETANPLGSLIVYLLEPRSEDGLATWKQFDGLKVGTDFPVLRLPQKTAMLTTAAEPLAEDRKRDLPITFGMARGFRGGGFSGAPVSVEWIDDEHWLRTHQGALLKVEARTGRAEPFADAGKILQSLQKIKGLHEKAAPGLARRLLAELGPGSFGGTLIEADSARKGLLFRHDHDLYYAAIDGTAGARLTDHAGEETLARFSPDGRHVAFVRDHDLFTVDVDEPKERALTTGGRDTLRRGEADWVYFEEIFNRSWSAFWWSPDSKRVAFMEFEDDDVKTLTMLDDTKSPRKVEVNKYPRAGEPNPRVRLGVVNAQGGPVAWTDLSDYTAQAFLISHVGWLPDSSAAYAYVQDRVQTWLDLVKIPVEGANAGVKPKRLFRDATRAWISDQAAITFLKDGSFLWLSERDGWKHIYRYDAEGKELERITSGPWEVRSIEHVDPESGWITFLGTKDAPMSTQLYRVKPGGAVERLTSGAGSFQAKFSPKGRYYLASWSDLTTPTQSRLFSADGRLVRTIDANPAHKIKEYRFGSRQRLQIPARDGFVMEAELILPPDFDPSKKHPAWFMTYGGPHTPTVADTWSGGRIWEQSLASEGFVVFRADPRPASGKGAVSAWTAYRKLGVQELEDIKDLIGWLKKKPYIDGDRVGMTGHSYGGYMTAFAMTHSDLFAAGIAGAPVTDWHDYDTIYTERLMGLPQDNLEGYKASSVVAAARNLKGKLLLIHGAIDDNVSVRNTMRFVQALQDAGKDFELMIYPGSRHGIFSPHYNKLMIDFIRRNLGSPQAVESSPPEPSPTQPGFHHP